MALKFDELKFIPWRWNTDTSDYWGINSEVFLFRPFKIDIETPRKPVYKYSMMGGSMV